MKTKKWNKTKYTRERSEVGPEGLRMDRIAWTRSLADLLTASDADIYGILLEDGLLVSLEGKTCPRCGQGSLSKVSATRGEGLPKLRCRAKSCHVYINPHHLHPLFVDGRGTGTTRLQIQAALLFLILNNVSHAVIHRLLNINHKVIEDMEKRLCYLRKEWVDAKEKLIDFGAGRPWADVEADETTFDRKHLGELASDLTTPIAWEQWCGIVKRGNPRTLVLCRLKPKESGQRAPGPGAIRKVEWAPLASKWLKDKKLILHTDAAKSYRCKVPGLLHDNVVHCKKRVKVNGKWRWKRPTFVRLVTHAIPGTKKKITVKAGTQVIDRAWRFLKERININQGCRVGSSLLRAKLRSAQYQYWYKNSDLWAATGELCSWKVAKLLAP